MFFIFALMAIGGAVSVIAQRNPVYSVISLIVTLFAIAGLFLLLNAQFIATIQVLIYAGAIMVLFLFVVMLLNLGKTAQRADGPIPLLGIKIAGGIVAACILGLIAVMLGGDYTTGVIGEISPDIVIDTGSVELVGRALFTTWFLPFIVVSVLLLVAMIGAVVLAMKPRKEPA